MSSARAPVLLAGAVLAGCAHGGAPTDNAMTTPTIQPTEEKNVVALAHALDMLLGQDPSATAVLERWCASRYMADPAVVTAHVDRAIHKAPDAATLARLQAGPGTTVGYRRVTLKCGSVVLSEADNWYRADLLTPEMRSGLEGSTPFGKLVRPLHPVRENLASEFQWPGQRPSDVLRHRALLRTADGQPLAEVIEVYQKGIAEGED